MARPAGSAASAPAASTIAGPSPSRPSTPDTRTNVSDATAAESCIIPEFAARAAESRAVLRRMGSRSGDVDIPQSVVRDANAAVTAGERRTAA